MMHLISMLRGVVSPQTALKPGSRENRFRSSVIFRISSFGYRTCGVLLALLLVSGCASRNPAQHSSEPITLVVLDPLAKELACACVVGYGQRDYRKLAARLESVLNQPVGIEFSDDLAESMNWIDPERALLIVGERSAVANGANRAGLKCRAVCELSDPAGGTTVNGIFVVRSDDPAKELKDIRDRKLLFGLADTEENRASVSAALRTSGAEPAGAHVQSGSYGDAALDVLDGETSPQPVAVIPGYALRLLEGCGSITPGDLKVIGRTQAMPFITVFAADNIPAEKQKEILDALLGIKGDPQLLEAMESRDGFKELTVTREAGLLEGWMGSEVHAASTVEQHRAPAELSRSTGSAAMKRSESHALEWPDWRGPNRDGRVPWLPKQLPASPDFVWKKAAMSGCLAGLSVSGGRLILAERDFAEEHDVYRCLDADTGELLWRIEFPARGHLDYGQSPRATPVISGDRAYLLGAFGDLRCVNVTDGSVVWERNLPHEFQADLPTWGMCSTPLVVDDLIIVNPGGRIASLVALDRITGRTRWSTPGAPAAYSAFICGEFGGRRQIVGYDQQSLGGWDVMTGERLWQLVPPSEGDFNVPTPVPAEGGVIVSTENNGTRFYRFDQAGRIIPQPVAEFADLSPDTATPVLSCGRVFGAHLGLRCLDLNTGLKTVWHHDDDTLGDYATLITDDERVLVVSVSGELILLDGRTDNCTILSRLRVFDDDVEVYSHPALAGTRLYMRGGSSVVCMDLAAK